MMNYKLQIKKSRNTGYTLLETMIAVSLFIVIVTMGMGALLNANLVYNKSKDMRSIMDNLSFTIEDMSRNLRTGYNYQCFDASHLSVSLSTTSTKTNGNYARSCASGWAIAFEPANGNVASYGHLPSNPPAADQWAYTISNGKVFKSTDGGNSFVQMTPDEVTIDQVYGFSVLGAEPPNYVTPPGNQQQPFVTIRLVGHITYKKVITSFSLQTSVSQRAVDL